VEPESHFDTTLDRVGALPAAWDLIKLIGRRKDRIVNQRLIRAGLQLVQYRKVPNLASAYLISRAGAAKLLATRVPFMRPIDVDMRWWWDNDLRIFGLMPYPLRLSQTSDLSSIGSRRGQRDWQSRLRKAAQTFDYNLKVLARSSLQATHWAAMAQPS
jgi:glycosyl transferase, family 25